MNFWGLILYLGVTGLVPFPILDQALHEVDCDYCADSHLQQALFEESQHEGHAQSDCGRSEVPGGVEDCWEGHCSQRGVWHVVGTSAEARASACS